jgi:hypothetical protein
MALPLPSNPIMEDAKCTQQLGEAESLAKSFLEAGNKLEDSPSVNCGAIRAPSPDASLVSVTDLNNVRLGRHSHYLPVPNGRRHASSSPVPPPTTRRRLQWYWAKNKGLALVLLAQLFGALMNATTRLLEIEGNNGNLQWTSHICLVPTNMLHRGRLSSLPDSICSNGHNCSMLVSLHVA